MGNLKKKLGIILVYLSLVLTILLCACIYPYREVLKCRSNSCYVERSYIFFNNRENAYYSFNKTDDIQVIYHHSSGRRGVSYYEIENLSDYNFSIFENSFAGEQTPAKLVDIIKSDNNHIKITKYWFGYKIENN